MKMSFFIKYYEYRMGIRFIVSHEGIVLTHRVLHNTVRKPEDEPCDISHLQGRLQDLFPSYDPNYCAPGQDIGDRFFNDFLHDLLTVSERMYRKYPKDRQRRRTKK